MTDGADPFDLASLIVALTLVPMLASKMLKKQNEKKHGFFEKLGLVPQAEDLAHEIAQEMKAL